MNKHFETFIPGKWVLAGEHAVLRGGRAVALPRHDIGLRLSFEPDSRLSRVEVNPMTAQEVVDGLIAALMEKAEKRTAQKQALPRGLLTLSSTIPIGGGLGSSSALCVGLVRLVAHGLRLSTLEQIEWATELENRFHGRSSGMDVTVATVGAPILFSQGPSFEKLDVHSLPTFRFHDTGLRSKTLECIDRVRDFEKRDRARAESLDERMKKSALECATALSEFDRGGKDAALSKLANAMRQAQTCFEEWGLVPERVRELALEIDRSGALAVKLTGAGNGGFLVSLWPT